MCSSGVLICVRSLLCLVCVRKCCVYAVSVCVKSLKTISTLSFAVYIFMYMYLFVFSSHYCFCLYTWRPLSSVFVPRPTTAALS